MLAVDTRCLGWLTVPRPQASAAHHCSCHQSPSTRCHPRQPHASSPMAAWRAGIACLMASSDRASTICLVRPVPFSTACHSAAAAKISSSTRANSTDSINAACALAVACLRFFLFPFSPLPWSMLLPAAPLGSALGSEGLRVTEAITSILVIRNASRTATSSAFSAAHTTSCKSESTREGTNAAGRLTKRSEIIRPVRGSTRRRESSSRVRPSGQRLSRLAQISCAKRFA
mmetsp:Transcript_44760/g.117392  ORF Transcript_44760/g.117392 Transcript_44760/m.117392 type:complete len:230 (+) Transcript_44760:207-896(+)